MSDKKTSPAVSIMPASRGDSCRPAMSAFLDRVLDCIYAEGLNGTRSPDRVCVDGYCGTTYVVVTPQDLQTVDGNHVLETVSVRNGLPVTAEQTPFSDRDIDFVNRFATTGALIRDQQTGGLVFVSQLCNYQGFDEALGLYGQLVAGSALAQSYGSMAALGVPDMPVADSAGAGTATGCPGGQSRWGEGDFSAVAKLLNRLGCLSNASGNGLTSEFPWAHGAVSAVIGDETCLFTMRSDLRRPPLGKGLSFRLELPRSFPETELIQIVSKLNWLETGALDMPPFFGAWSTRIACSAAAELTGRICFAGFWPDLMFHPGSAQNLAVWMRQRAVFAREVIENQRY